MGYAGQDYGPSASVSGSASVNGQSLSNLSTAHASGVVVIGALLALVAIRMGFRGINVGGASLRVG